MAAIDQLKARLRQKANERGLGWLYNVTYRGSPILEYIVQRESGWDPGVPSAYNAQGTEDSWGLFQLNRAGGVGTNHSVQELTNADRNMDIALENIAANLRTSGNSLAAGFQNWNNPALDPGFDSFIRTEGKGAAQQGEGSYPMSGMWQEGTTMAEPQTDNIVVRWMMSQYGMSLEDAELAFLRSSATYTKMYNDFGAGGGTSGAMTDYEAWSATHQTSEDELKRAQTAIETLVDLGVWDADRAVSEWTNTQAAIQNRMGEAGRRGEYVSGVMEERAKHMTPTEGFPGFEGPNSLASQIMGRRGLTAPTLKGTPMSALPDPWEAFRQGNVSVGLPAEAQGIPAYPEATNPYAAAMPGMESLAGGVNPWQQFQLGANESGGVSSPVNPSADMRTGGSRYMGPDLNAWLQQFGIQLPSLMNRM